MKRWIGCLTILTLLVAGLSYAGYWYYQSKKQVEWTTEEVDTGTIRQVIAATGSLAAVDTVEVGTQISGMVASVSADFNDQVSAGQQIGLIDPSAYEAQVQTAMANLAGARASERNYLAQTRNLQASLLSARADQEVGEANVKKAKVSQQDSLRNLNRMKELFQRKLISQSDLDGAQTAFDGASAGVDAAVAQFSGTKSKEESVKAQIDAVSAQREGALAQIQQAESQLNVARINLERTKIFSPIDGVILSRTIDVGQTVAASLQAPKLFVIAKDLKKMEIDTAVDESEIAKVKEGQRVSFTVDAFRGREFRGKVQQIRLSPTISQNVVTYSVMVTVENPDLSLKPGMTANVEIMVDKREKVKRIPTRAQFFKPPAEFLVGVASSSPDRMDQARVYVLANGKPEPRDIIVGLSTNSQTEVVGGSLDVGQAVIVEVRKGRGKGPGKQWRQGRGRGMGRMMH